MSPSVVSWVVMLALGVCLSAACWCDLKSRRIPNSLIASGMSLGFILQIALPSSTGLFTNLPGSLGGVAALLGCAFGMAALIPMYAIGAMGAGDVKMMGMVGIFLGPVATIEAVVWSVAAGGVLAVLVALWTGVLQAVVRNVRQAVTQSIATFVLMRKVEMSVATVGGTSLPYAFAISAGTICQIFFARSGHTLFT